ncbi:hypothetical protein OB905_07790 [Halobacteria archaeon AArc-dxtr1]|nr:hypothetical protein [Halobacteria archaeon AArc-dxtr1]
MGSGDRIGEGAIDWGQVIESLVYLFPPVIGVGIVGLLQTADPGVPGLQWALVLFGTFGYAVLALSLTIALFADARSCREHSDWSPRPWIITLLALASAPFALAPFVAVAYLYRRYEHLGATAGWSGWWLVVAASLAATLFGLVAAVVGIVLVIPGLLLTGAAVAGAVAFGSFPIAIHQDAAYVDSRGSDWQPNPALYLGLALASLFVAPLQPLLAGYYLWRRRQALGAP